MSSRSKVIRPSFFFFFLVVDEEEGVVVSSAAAVVVDWSSVCLLLSECGWCS